MNYNNSKENNDEDFKITENSEKSFKNIIFILLAVSGVVIFFIFRSYLYSILLALFIYITTRKLNLALKKKFNFLTPWIMILIVLTSFVLPIYFIIRTLLVKVSSDLSKIKNLFIEDNLIEVIMDLPFLTDFFTQKEFFWLKIPNIYQEISGSYLDILDFDNLTSIVTNSSSFILGSLDYFPTSFLFEVFFTTLVLFFLYANGREIEQFVLNHIPFSQEIEERIGRRFVFVVQTVVKGNLLISLLQGLVVYLFLIFLKIPAAFLYASIATIFAFIPVIGTAVIWLPVGLYILLIQNSMLTSILYMIFSFLSYLILENYIKPKLLDKNLKVHPMLIFLSLIGGIKEFGIIGIFLGPVSVTFLVIIWDFWNYFKELQKDNKV